jgi:hypothetical protein
VGGPRRVAACLSQRRRDRVASTANPRASASGNGAARSGNPRRMLLRRRSMDGGSEGADGPLAIPLGSAAGHRPHRGRRVGGRCRGRRP